MSRTTSCIFVSLHILIANRTMIYLRAAYNIVSPQLQKTQEHLYASLIMFVQHKKLSYQQIQN